LLFLSFILRYLTGCTWILFGCLRGMGGFHALSPDSDQG
jgi:hypothetical protein